jgi:hypothetical protein
MTHQEGGKATRLGSMDSEGEEWKTSQSANVLRMTSTSCRHLSNSGSRPTLTFWKDCHRLLLNTKVALDEMEGKHKIDSESLSSLENAIESDETSRGTNVNLMEWLNEQ